MKIDLERFLALTAMLAAPLVTANGCIITDGDGNDANSTDDGASADDDGTDPSGSPTSADDAPMTDDSGTDGGTIVTTGTDDGSTGADSTGDSTGGSDTTGGNELGNCCEPDGSMGCEVPEVSDCVCAEDPYCCETDWDINCAAEVNTLGCGECVLPPQVWDCYCTADCDGTLVETPWQVCSGDELDAADMGLAACEADLGKQCEMFVCEACSCFTAEVAEIDCL